MHQCKNKIKIYISSVLVYSFVVYSFDLLMIWHFNKQILNNSCVSNQ